MGTRPTHPVQPPPSGPVTSRAEADAAPPFQFEEVREQALLKMWRAGDPGALQELLLAVEPRLMSLCFRMSGRPQDARDLCQEAMVKIIHGLPGFAGQSRVSTWMIRVTMNVCLTDRRRAKLRRTTSLNAPAGGAEAENEGASIGDRLPESREPTTFGRVEKGEELQRLSRGLARIDPEQRALIILRDGQGLDYAEIAEVMDVPVGTIKSRLFRARVALREEVEKG